MKFIHFLLLLISFLSLSWLLLIALPMTVGVENLTPVFSLKNGKKMKKKKKMKNENFNNKKMKFFVCCCIKFKIHKYFRRNCILHSENPSRLKPRNLLKKIK